MNAQQLIAEVELLPVEQRALVVDSLLQSLTPCDPANADAWAVVAQKRLSELAAGSLQAVDGDEVFNRILRRIG